jgi:hypothetical protein
MSQRGSTAAQALKVRAWGHADKLSMLVCRMSVLSCLLQLRSIGMVGYVLGPFIFAACMFGMVMQVSSSADFRTLGVPVDGF